MKKKSPFQRMIRLVGGTLLGVIGLIAAIGLYKFVLVANHIYDPDTFDNRLTTRPQTEAVRKGQPETLPSPAEHTTQPPNRAKRSGPDSPAKNLSIGHTSPDRESQAAQTILLLGVDSREGERARSDTIILATVPPAGGTIHLLSIPRDTYVPVRGHGYTKINHAMTYGGAKLLKQTVENFLGVKIDHTATIDFEGFRQIIDKLGGVDLTVEKTMNYDDPTDGTHIHLVKGQAIQNGAQALDYARFRHDEEADTGRMRRQQALLRAMMQKGGQPSQWGKLFELTDIVGDHVKTDIPLGEMVRLFMAYGNIRSDQIQTLSLKGENKISPQDHLWYFYADPTQVADVSRQLQQLKRGMDTNGNG
ncbi:MAG TPA: LCP family protein [Bacilli bacterium]|nr:LCP family protein [Bacilli bacterium]